jgi:putative Mg2+ transporter-C (MgtC) family protein
MTEIGFPGAGIILKGELFDKKNLDDTLNKKAVNLTIAATIWFFEGIGMTSGFNFYFIAIVSIAFDVIDLEFHK